MRNIKLSVICPIYNEEKYIVRCMDSIINSDFPKEQIEVLFIDGNSTDLTRSLLSEYLKKYSFIRLLDNPRRTVPYALNIGIKEASGEFIVRLDAHAFYPENYFSILVSKLQELDADNVGGVCITLPAKDSILCKAIAVVMSNGFGVGNSYFRIGASQVKKVDTVPFGCFRRELFSKIGYFDEELTRNQDDEFNARIIKNGGSIYLLPDLNISYLARDKVSKTALMFYQYGLFKPLVNKKIGSPATFRQFVPLCFILGLFFGGIISLFSSFIFFLYVFVIGLYWGTGLFFTRHEIMNDFKLIFYIPWLFFILHVSYGWGYLCGIIKFLVFNKQNVNVEINR